MRGDVWLEKDAKGDVYLCIDKGNSEVAKTPMAEAKANEARAWKKKMEKK